jgi:hypothetical protein
MGSSKVRKISDRKVKFVHQLNADGSAYAEDVTIELQKGVDPGRLEYLASLDGQVGVVSYSFSPSPGDHSSLKFPEEE